MYSMMSVWLKVSAVFLLLPLQTVHGQYTPNNDVNAHSRIALDTLDISNALVGEIDNDTKVALEIYVNGKNRPDNSLQGMAQKDWVAGGAPDGLKQAYESILGPDFLDSYTLDAIYCNNTFEGKSEEMCRVSAMKNLICTALHYAQYEGAKAVASSSSKYWDELFAFWYGVYNESMSDAVGQGSPGYVQWSRDQNFGTAFKDAAMDALILGQQALGGDEVDTKGIRIAFDAWNAAQVASYTQAALKYAYELAQPDANVDGKWAEGYTYFRCAAGLFNDTFARTVDTMYRTTDKDAPPDDLFCSVAKEVIESPDLGFGVSATDLNLEEFLPDIESDCNVTLAAASSAFSVNSHILLILTSCLTLWTMKPNSYVLHM
jgi:hypothetical protein